MRIATISSKGQITLPSLLLKELELKPKNKVIIKRAKRAIVIEPIERSFIDKLAGSLTKYVDPKKLGKPFSEVMDETIKKAAAELVKK